MKAITTVTVEEFNRLLVNFTKELEKVKLSSTSITKTLQGFRGRQETYLKHSQRETVFILFYLKCCPTYDLAGISFDVDRSQASRWVEQWLAILSRVLEREAVLPAKEVTRGTEFSELFHEVALVQSSFLKN